MPRVGTSWEVEAWGWGAPNGGPGIAGTFPTAPLFGIRVTDSGRPLYVTNGFALPCTARSSRLSGSAGRRRRSNFYFNTLSKCIHIVTSTVYFED